MDSETWLDKATRLQRSLFRRGEPSRLDDEAAARERIELALWLRREFPDEPRTVISSGHGVESAGGSTPGTPEPPGQCVPKLALSREEAAQAIGQSAVTIDRLTKRGLLRPSRATRRPVYPVWEIERFLRETSVSILP